MRRTQIHRLLVLVALALSALPGLDATSDARAKEDAAVDHVVLVIFGGGVRARDLLDEKAMPTVHEMAENGRTLAKVRSDAAHAFDGATRILTGRSDAITAPATRPTAPTLMEYVRVGRDLPREKVWFISYEGEDQLKLAHSTHPDFGSGVGPSEAFGAGAFGAPLAAFLETTGRPDPLPDEAWPILRRLRGINRGAIDLYLPESVGSGLPESERVERALLEEIDRRSLLVRGAAPNDLRAWRAARTVLQVHRPVLTVIRLGDHGVASRAARDYHAALAANDKELARTRALIADDPVMGGKTLLALISDVGRNAGENERGAIDADDESDDHRELVFVAEGPGFRKTKGRLKGPRRIEDVCPTLGRLLGVPTGEAEGAVWEPLLEPAR